MKWFVCLVLVVLLGWSWNSFNKSKDGMTALQTQIDQEIDRGDPEGIVPKLEGEKQGMEGQRLFLGILATFLGAGVVGIVVVVYLLPFFAQRVTHAVYDSAELVEKDAMHDARAKIAQGDYEGAIESYKEAAAADPLNRLPWVEIAKIYKDHLEQPKLAIQTIRHALESQEWEINDAAYFLFRLAELYYDVEGDYSSAVTTMNQVIEQFPGTRHSANAKHKLHEWSTAQAASGINAEEEEYLARMRKANEQNRPS